MKKISLVCCLVLLMNLLCPAGMVAHASSTSTDLCSHEWIWQSKDANTCQNICALCDWVSLEEAHMAYCDAPGVCYKCGHAGSMDSTHRGELRWEYNETEHMQIWDCCGEEQYRSYHFASCIGEANVCANCGYIGTMDVLHSNQEMEYNDEVHWEQCLDCGETFGLSSHYASCQAPNKCLDCGYESELIQEITHTNTEWQVDNTNCWLYCTACQKEVQESLAPHLALCTVPGECGRCGYKGEIAITHAGDLICEHNDTECWVVCSACNQELENSRAQHKASCTNPGVCMGCGYEGEMDIGHSGDMKWEYSETDHWRVCTVCGQTVWGPDEHFAICDNPTVCVACGYTGSIESVSHSGDIKWEYNETGHWQVCTACGPLWDPIGHYATCDNPTVCANCGYTGVIESVMHGDQKWEYAETGHWSVCNTCGQTVNGPSAHFAICDNPTVCALCGYTGTIELLSHTDPMWEHDETEHWSVCGSCGYTGATYEHSAACNNPMVCADCGYTGLIESIYHLGAFVDGKCELCGQECDHPSSYTHYDILESGVRDIDEVGHTGYTIQEIYEECSTCGMIHNRRTKQNAYREPHFFEDGACTYCGYTNICTHPEFSTSYHYGANGSEVTYSDPDQNGHIATGYAVVVHECTTCLETITEVETEITSRREDHAIGSDGICYICGYQNPCTHPNPVDEGRTLVYITGESVYLDKENHEVTAYYGEQYDCPDCGHSWFVMEKEPTTQVLPHEYFDGFCGYCNYFCPHEAMETRVTKENLTYSSPNADGHTVSYQEKTTTLCPDCGRTRTATQDASLQEAHQMTDGKCVLCGYEELQSGETPTEAPTAEPTQQPTQVPTAEPTQQPTQAPTAEPTQQPTQAPTTEPTQPNPTPIVTPAPEEEEEDEEPVRPESTATPTAPPIPTATPEPVFTQAPENEVVHGVKVEDEMPMVDAMLTVMNAIATESKTGTVQVQIVNFDKILTAEENIAITQLKPQEQLLTFLAVIGIQPEASDALTQAQKDMSEESIAIQEQIKQRIATMSEAERTAFEDALMEYFPMETVTIDGQEYTWFTIDLEVNVDGVIRIERYGFRLEGESWIFAKLEIST